VIDAIVDAYGHHYANVHRGIYELSEDATARYEGARKRLAGFIGATSDRELIFVRNATEAINLVAFSWGRANVGPGDLILSTEMEHHANLVPWQQLAAETGAALEYVAITEDGRLDMADLRRRLERGPKLLAIGHVSNSLGTINPVAELVRLAHDAGALVLVDAAQSVPHMPVSVTELGADFLAFSGHKMLGPSGIGALWARRSLLDAMPPFMTGGSMISRVTLSGTTWNEAPWKFEAGTPAIAEAIGLAAAVDYLEALGMAHVREHERFLFERAWAALDAISGVRLLGPADPDQHAGVISFVVDAIHPHDLATVLDREGIAVRAGHHCAQPVMLHYDLPATTRASFYVYNDLDDVERLTAAIGTSQRLFS
jgi:cysteine desulfurase/selenocysteine lyase